LFILGLVEISKIAIIVVAIVRRIRVRGFRPMMVVVVVVAADVVVVVVVTVIAVACPDAQDILVHASSHIKLIVAIVLDVRMKIEAICIM
jgi:hypothetical protein